MKKINKSVKFLLALSLFLSTGTPVLAGTIIGSEDNPRPTSEISVNSNIGAFNPLDPNQPNPIDPDNPDQSLPNHPTWLNVSIPTAVMFNSTGDEHTVLTSPEYTITNHSGRGVDVYVHTFEKIDGDSDPIKYLNLVPSTIDNLYVSFPVELLNNESGFIRYNEPALLMTIREIYQIGMTEDAYFAFAGSAESLVGDNTSVAPTFNLVLGFRVNDLGRE